MSNYINYYFDEENKFTAKIHNNGKYRIVKNETNLLKLLEISQKYGYKINREGIIKKKAKQITKEYDKYQKRKKRLKILGHIAENMVLSRKNKVLGKTILVAGILTTIAITSAQPKGAEAHEENISEISYSTVQTLDDNIKTNIEELSDYEFVETDNKKNNELDMMLQNDSFHFSYEDRTNSDALKNAKRYEDLFEKYANRYGLDKNLLLALASQESSGEHYKNLEKGPAAGIMQIEKKIHTGTTISAFNFETNEVERVKVTEDNLKDIETNIQIGSMILRNYLENNNYNIPLTLQTYNFGPGNMQKVLNACSSLEQENIKDMRNTPTNNSWLKYRAHLNIGDAKYVEHVFSFLENNTTLSVKNRENKNISINITNDLVNTK